MATIVKITTTIPKGSQVLAAIEQLRSAIGTLEGMNGIRAEAIGAGQASMATIFGTADNAQAQALNDRWAAFVTAFQGSGDTGMSSFRDLINAVTQA